MKLAVIFGGQSDEHEVSRNSAVNVLKSLGNTDHEILKIGITKRGRWYTTDADFADIASGEWENHPDNRQVCFACDPVVHGVLVFDSTDHAHTERIDCAIPVLHGDYGEDGTIQGVFEMSGIPYVGPGVAASANCMDKSIAKQILASAGVNMADYMVITRYEYDNDKDGVRARLDVFNGGKLPLFVKPSSAGSSVGATKVTERDGLEEAIEYAMQFDNKVLVEEMIVGRELEVAVLGNDEPQASCIGEILTAGEFYDYDSKYNNPDSQTRLADDLPESVANAMRAEAVKVYKTLGCRGLSRVDFFLSEEKGIVLNEVNTLPGFTNISMYPQLWAAMGVDGTELIERLIALAME